MSQTFQIKSLKCEKVVVFTDRAEVKRSLNVKLKNGENELVISNVSSFVDQDSVRVEGKGEATVLDVVCEKRRVHNSEANTTEKVKKLQEEIQDLENDAKVLSQKIQRIEKQLAVLHEFANTLSKPQQTADNSVEKFLNFLELYGTRLEQLDKQKYDLDQEIAENNQKKNVCRTNLNKVHTSNYNDVIEIKILIDAKKDDIDVNLTISYVISHASWTPKYDIRVYSDNKTMIINYYGMICQSTGEDWNDTLLSLSTAVPSIGGNVPELETLNVGIKRIQIPAAMSYFARGKKELQYHCYDPTIEDCVDEYCSVNLMSQPEIRVQTTKVQEGLIASTFDIPRQATIPADNNTHKVSIGIINLKPEFEYETVPKKTPHAFLKAKVKNTSSYAMLAGPANVFLDNNFVAKTNLKSYSPQEEFTCSLGVDPSIRVDYKPIKKYQEQSGLISKTRTTTYEQVIEIKNTSSNAVKLLLSDQLPLSNNEKIQVKLLEPVLKNSQIVKLNKQNNLEFDLKIPAGKQSDLLIKYAVEHNANEEIEFC